MPTRLQNVQNTIIPTIPAGSNQQQAAKYLTEAAYRQGLTDAAAASTKTVPEPDPCYYVTRLASDKILTLADEVIDPPPPQIEVVIAKHISSQFVGHPDGWQVYLNQARSLVAKVREEIAKETP